MTDWIEQAMHAANLRQFVEDQKLRLRECDCCGEMKTDVVLVAHPSFGDTCACAKCRGWEE